MGDPGGAAVGRMSGAAILCRAPYHLGGELGVPLSTQAQATTGLRPACTLPPLRQLVGGGSGPPA